MQQVMEIIGGMTGPQIANVFCLAVLCIGLLMGKWPLGLVGMTSCVLLVLTGVMTVEEAFSGFANQTVILLACMYVLSSAFSRTRLMAKIRNLMNSLQGKKGVYLVIGVFGVCWIFAQFLPSGVNVPLMVAFLSSLGNNTEGEVTPSRLMFPCTAIAGFCASMLPFGMALTGAANQNALYEGLVTDPSQLLQVMDPIIYKIIPGILALLFCIFGYRLLPKGRGVSQQDSGKSAVQTGGKPFERRAEIIVYICFFGVMITLLMSNLIGDIMYVIPAVAVLILYFTKAMSLPDIKKSLTGTIVFMVAGVLVMSDAMGKTGLGEVVGELILTLIGENPSPYYALFIFGLATGIMTSFMSNIASNAVITPLAVSTAIAAGWNPIPFALITRPMAWCAILLPSASSAAATGHAAAGYKLSESLRFSVPFFLLCLGGCMLSSYLFFPF